MPVPERSVVARVSIVVADCDGEDDPFEESATENLRGQRALTKYVEHLGIRAVACAEESIETEHRQSRNDMTALPAGLPVEAFDEQFVPTHRLDDSRVGHVKSAAPREPIPTASAPMTGCTSVEMDNLAMCSVPSTKVRLEVT